MSTELVKIQNHSAVMAVTGDESDPGHVLNGLGPGKVFEVRRHVAQQSPLISRLLIQHAADDDDPAAPIVIHSNIDDNSLAHIFEWLDHRYLLDAPIRPISEPGQDDDCYEIDDPSPRTKVLEWERLLFDRWVSEGGSMLTLAVGALDLELINLATKAGCYLISEEILEQFRAAILMTMGF